MIFEGQLSDFPRLPATVEDKPDELGRPRPADVTPVKNHGLRNVSTLVACELQAPGEINILFVRGKVLVKVFVSPAVFWSFYKFESGFAIYGRGARRAEDIGIMVVLTVIDFPLSPVNYAPGFEHLNSRTVQNFSLRINLEFIMKQFAGYRSQRRIGFHGFNQEPHKIASQHRILVEAMEADSSLGSVT